MTDNVATLEGYTVELHTDTGLALLTKPHTDLRDRFKAWDTEEQDWVWVNGWEFTFGRGEAGWR